MNKRIRKKKYKAAAAAFGIAAADEVLLHIKGPGIIARICSEQAVYKYRAVIKQLDDTRKRRTRRAVKRLRLPNGSMPT